MLEGLLISLTGMLVCFIVLTILMLVIMGLERLFRDKLISEEIAAKLDFSDLTDSTNLNEKPILDDEVRLEPSAVPENTAEVAAIGLALTAYLKARGKKLDKPITIGDTHYHVESSDISYTPVTVVVNGESYRAALGEDGLPRIEQTSSATEPLRREPQRGWGWRSAYPPSQGSFWNRRGWTGKG